MTSCATCRHCRQVNCYPWNTGKTQGSILRRAGYVCMGLDAPEAEEPGPWFFMDDDKGLCEAHAERPQPTEGT